MSRSSIHTRRAACLIALFGLPGCADFEGTFLTMKAFKLSSPNALVVRVCYDITNNNRETAHVPVVTTVGPPDGKPFGQGNLTLDAPSGRTACVCVDGSLDASRLGVDPAAIAAGQRLRIQSTLNGVTQTCTVALEAVTNLPSIRETCFLSATCM